MATIRQQILEAAVTALNTGTPSGVPSAAQRRITPRDIGDLPAIDVAPGEEVVVRVGGAGGPIVKRSMKFKVRCWVKGDAPEIAADPLIAWATKALAGSRLGGLALQIDEVGTTWIYDIADDVYGVAEVEFSAEYVTKFNDQEAKS